MRDATLCFVVKGDKMLLMLKKKGIGKGKITGPGGRIEEGETEEQCAVREVNEEVGITPLHPVKMGVVDFSNGIDGMKVHIFLADDFDGDIKETDEADPFWAGTDELPFGKMWEDYSIWLPLMMEGKKFEGRCVYTEDWDKIIEHEIRVSGLPV